MVIAKKQRSWIRDASTPDAALLGYEVPFDPYGKYCSEELANPSRL
jgi:hypothetical protein